MSRRRWTFAALLLSTSYAGVLAATAPAMGYTRDEGYYFKAAEEYGRWWDTLFSHRFLDAFGDDEIRVRFGYNTEHPALVKLTQGVTFRVLHQWTGLTGPAQGFRAAGFLFAALSLMATFWLGAELVSPAVGFLAALFLAAMPRYFYDAHLACFDVPITAMWTLALWSYARAVDGPREHARRRAIFAGVVFGLALATKLNALFLPPIFVALWIHSRGPRGLFKLVPGPSGGIDLVPPRIPLALIACAILGPLVFFLHWPYIWHDTVARVSAYVAFHLHHEHYPIRYFHDVYVRPPFPWHFAWVMTALTVPVSVLVPGALGLLGAAWRLVRRGPTTELLLVLGTVLPIVLITLPGTPIFGGVKHWYNALPMLAILAARVIVRAGSAISVQPRVRALATTGLALVALLPGVLGVVASHPNGIGFYNEIAGGFRGGAELGMQRTFWGGTNLPLLPEVAALPKGTQVFLDHTNYDAFRMYVREGVLPSWLGFANAAEQAQAATVFEDREGAPFTAEGALSSAGPRPQSGVYVDEVTLVQLFTRQTGRGPPPGIGSTRTATASAGDPRP